MTTRDQTIALKVNEKGMIKALKDTFTCQANVLSELMQNGRRAGATRIDVTYDASARVLEVVDDGSGIEDFSKLLELASSGWDAATIEKEAAFGIGFVSAVFGCDRLEIESRGRRLAADTKDILSFSPVKVTACDTVAVTRVRLFGTAREFHRNDVESKVRGFPLPVSYNGGMLERPDADGEDFAVCGVGRIRLSQRPSGNFLCYLQGFPVCRTSRFGGWDNWTIVHLDSTFRGRVPDRQSLVDLELAEKRINACVLATWAEWFSARKAAGDELALLNHIRLMKSAGCLHLLNDIDRLPPGVLSQFSTSDVSDSELYGPNMVGSILTREYVTQKVVLLPSALDESSLDDVRANFGERFDEEVSGVFNAVQYLAHLDALRIEDLSALDPGHWLFSLPSLVHSLWPVSPRLVGRQVPFEASGNCFADDFLACESIQIEGPLGVVEADNGFVLVRHGEEKGMRLALTRSSDTRAACAMYSSYTDDDHYREDWLSEDEDALDTELVAALDSNAAVFLTSALSGFRYGSMGKKVQGRRFSVSFSAEGEVMVEEVLAQAA